MMNTTYDLLGNTLLHNLATKVLEEQLLKFILSNYDLTCISTAMPLVGPLVGDCGIGGRESVPGIVTPHMLP